MTIREAIHQHVTSYALVYYAEYRYGKFKKAWERLYESYFSRTGIDLPGIAAKNGYKSGLAYAEARNRLLLDLAACCLQFMRLDNSPLPEVLKRERAKSEKKAEPNTQNSLF